MYLFYVKVKLITKQTYYVSGVRLYKQRQNFSSALCNMASAM